MQTEDTYITASCVIRDNIIYKDSAPLFANKEANIGEFLLSAYQHFTISYPKFYKMDYLSKLGLLATEVLLKPGFNAVDYKPEEVGVLITNASSSLDTDRRYFDTVKDIASPALFVYTLPNILIGEICIKNKFKGENAFFVFEKFDAAFIEQYVKNIINNNIVKACICGWIELLDNEYKAVLYLVEAKDNGKSLHFTKENINKIYQR